MRTTTLRLLAGASMLMIASAAQAQTSANAGSAAQEANEGTRGEEANPAEIIVTARRKNELLIDVPQTVTAVTNQQLQDFQINDFQDIQNLIAGLQLQTQQLGFGATASTRGVTFQVTSQGTPTVEQYLNEMPIEPNLMAQSNFDVGQIEVLRGPQGTLRGRSAPSGLITETTRRPDLDSVGGYVSSSISSNRGFNLQGAVGVPIVRDVLAVRLAGSFDRDDAGGVRSVNNPLEPYQRTWSTRATVRFEPASNFSAVVMWQHVEHDIHEFGGTLFGPGATGLSNFANFTRPASSLPCSGLTNCGNPSVFAPPNFNGPALTADQRLAVDDQIGLTHQYANIVTGQIDWRFGGQKLSYVGGFFHFIVQTQGDSDGSNTVVGVPRKISYGSNSETNRVSQELRLSSEEPLFGGLLDYTVGGFYLREFGPSRSGNKNSILMQGAFGSPLGAGTLPGGGSAPGTLSPYTYDPRYTVGYLITTPRDEEEKSLFASFTLHLGDKTEFTAGGRQIWRENAKEVIVTGEPGLAAIFNPNGLGACPAQITSGTFLTGGGTVTGSAGTPIPVVGQTYAGTCDIAVNLGTGAPATLFPPIPFGKRKWAPFVYNLSLSHKFTPDIMAYVSYGTAWRAGPGPITAAPSCADANLCQRYNFLDPETSKAIEVGVKAALFDRRLNLALAVYRQSYSGLFVLGSPVPYLPSTCTGAVADDPNTPANERVVPAACTAVSSGGFTYNAPVKTWGIDLDASFRLNDDFNFGVLFSYAKGRYDNAVIPCRDANFDGVPDTDTLPTLNQWIDNPKAPLGPATCKVNTSSTTATPWSLTLRGEFSKPVAQDTRAFLRALVNIYPSNTNVQVSNINFIPNAYSLVNLWAGIRDEKGRWELSISARNLLNNKTVLSQSVDQTSLITPQRNLPFANDVAQTTANSGYRSISFVPRREFAINLRMAFGSR